jgi:hypothetical protein
MVKLRNLVEDKGEMVKKNVWMIDGWKKELMR